MALAKTWLWAAKQNLPLRYECLVWMQNLTQRCQTSGSDSLIMSIHSVPSPTYNNLRNYTQIANHAHDFWWWWRWCVYVCHCSCEEVDLRIMLARWFVADGPTEYISSTLRIVAMRRRNDDNKIMIVWGFLYSFSLCGIQYIIVAHGRYIVACDAIVRI